MNNEQLIEHLRSEVRRVKIQRNEIEQNLFKACKRIRELVSQSNELHSENKKIKKHLEKDPVMMYKHPDGTISSNKPIIKMKPFDLSKALAGAPVVTRDGRKVEEIHLFNSDRIKSKLVVILEGEDLVHGYSIEGFFRSESDEPSAYDLFMDPVKKKGWVNLYRRGATGVESQLVHETKEEAASFGGGSDFICTTEIEWEE